MTTGTSLTAAVALIVGRPAQAALPESTSATTTYHRNDRSFIAPGAVAFKRDLPNSEIHLLNAGHFALDEKNDDIASLVLAFLAEHSV